MLFQAIHLTAPRFNIEEIDRGLYGLDEVKVINQIALTYSRNDEHKKAIDIYYQLLRYIKKHFQNILQSGGLLPLVCYNYARELDLVKRYEDALEIAQLGWQACVQYGQYRNLPAIIALMAECYYFLGENHQSQEFYRKAYYLCQTIDDYSCLRTVVSETKKIFWQWLFFLKIIWNMIIDKWSWNRRLCVRWIIVIRVAVAHWRKNNNGYTKQGG